MLSVMHGAKEKRPIEHQNRTPFGEMESIEKWFEIHWVPETDKVGEFLDHRYLLAFFRNYFTIIRGQTWEKRLRTTLLRRFWATLYMTNKSLVPLPISFAERLLPHFHEKIRTFRFRTQYFNWTDYCYAFEYLTRSLRFWVQKVYCQSIKNNETVIGQSLEPEWNHNNIHIVKIIRSECGIPSIFLSCLLSSESFIRFSASYDLIRNDSLQPTFHTNIVRENNSISLSLVS